MQVSFPIRMKFALACSATAAVVCGESSASSAFITAVAPHALCPIWDTCGARERGMSFFSRPIDGAESLKQIMLWKLLEALPPYTPVDCTLQAPSKSWSSRRQASSRLGDWGDRSPPPPPPSPSAAGRVRASRCRRSPRGRRRRGPPAGTAWRRRSPCSGGCRRSWRKVDVLLGRIGTPVENTS